MESVTGLAWNAQLGSYSAERLPLSTDLPRREIERFDKNLRRTASYDNSVELQDVI